MSGIKFAGPVSLRISSFFALNKIAVSTYLRHARGRKISPSWDANLEIGVRFWRRQFTYALRANDIATGRLILDSLQTETPDVYEVDHQHQDSPKGDWYIPHTQKRQTKVLYLHGGGYTFHGAMSKRFAAMLAHHIGAPVFAPDYRLTPENPHPAQAEDAMAAWRYISNDVPPEQITVIGDSAGGHMMLMLLLDLQQANLPQPALGIGLCPWTDIGDRGASLHENDKTDLVQGWMALQFGDFLDPNQRFGRSQLSPIEHNFAGLAPLYLQTSSMEILRDMTIDFARVQANNNAEVLLDVWPDMPHDFQLMDSKYAASADALKRIEQAVQSHVIEKGIMPTGPHTLLENHPD